MTQDHDSNAKSARIPLSIPHLEGRESEYLQGCIRDGWVSSVGPFVKKFEEQFAKRLGAKRAVACSSGTAAIHLTLAALNIGENDFVLVSSLTFIASVNPIRYVGAEPVLVDSEKTSLQIDPNLVESFLKNECAVQDGQCIHTKTNKRVAAIMPVHILGHGAAISRLAQLAEKYGLYLVEDAAEALGVRIDGRSAGRFGKAGCFSFNGNKIMTTGGGGMVVTDCDKLADRLKFLSEQAKLPGVEYIHEEIGFNYRMTNVHAAIGLGQLEGLDEKLNKKNIIADRYKTVFSDLEGISWIEPVGDVVSSWWLFTIKIDEAITQWNAQDLMHELLNHNIECRPLWQPIHLSKTHENAMFLGGGIAQKIYAQALSLPSSVGLNEEEQNRVIKVILDFSKREKP